MRITEHRVHEQHLGNGPRLVMRLDELRETRSPQPLELLRRERGPQRVVGQQGKCGHSETQGTPCSQCCAALQRSGPPGRGLGVRFHVALLLAGTARSVFPCGTTLNTTRAAGFREVMTAAWTSDESIAR